MKANVLTDFIREIVRKADGNRARLCGPILEQTKTLKSMIEAAEVVFGVYKTHLNPEGYNVTVIKGQALLDVARVTGECPVWDAVPCRSASEAEAIRNVLGDLSQQIWPERESSIQLIPPPA